MSLHLSYIFIDYSMAVAGRDNGRIAEQLRVPDTPG